MIPCLVGPDGECTGTCEVNEDGSSPQIAEGNTEWTVVMLDRVPDPHTERVVDGAIVARSTEDIEEEIAERVEAQITGIEFLPATDPLRLTHQALFCLAKHAGEGGLDHDSSFGEYLTWVASGA